MRYWLAAAGVAAVAALALVLQSAVRQPPGRPATAPAAPAPSVAEAPAITPPAPPPRTEFQATVEDALRAARRFQLPGQVLNEWGDPDKFSGVYEPRITYKSAALRLQRYKLRELWLVYHPPVRDPYRLKLISLTYDERIAEKEITGWLGQPVTRKSKDLNAGDRHLGLKPNVVVDLDYDERDRPNLGIRSVIIYDKEVVVYADGSPR